MTIALCKEAALPDRLTQNCRQLLLHRRNQEIRVVGAFEWLAGFAQMRMLRQERGGAQDNYPFGPR